MEFIRVLRTIVSYFLFYVTLTFYFKGELLNYCLLIATLKQLIRV